MLLETKCEIIEKDRSLDISIQNLYFSFIILQYCDVYYDLFQLWCNSENSQKEGEAIIKCNGN